MRLRVVLTSISIVIASAATAEDWTQFRGANHNYLAEADALPTDWSNGNNIRWKTAVPGEGWASPVVSGEKVFIATAIQEVEGKDTAPPPEMRSPRIGADSVYRWELHCLDLSTGETLWHRVALRANPRVRTHHANTYASETPVTDGTHVYVYFGMMGLYCYDFDGELVWSKDLGGYKMDGDWGTGSSPILYNDTLYLQIDNEERSFLVALNPTNGEERWRVERDEVSSWSTPMIWRNKVRTELITCSKFVRSYDPATGEQLWSMNLEGGRSSASATGNMDALFFGNERRSDGGGDLFAVRAGASGDISRVGEGAPSDSLLWQLHRLGPDFASPLLYDGSLYIFGRNRGSIGVFDPATGDRRDGIERLPGARSFWSSPWGYDGNVYCIDEGGTAFVVASGPDPELVATIPLNEEVRASPAIIDGALILRSKQHVYRIGN